MLRYAAPRAAAAAVRTARVQPAAPVAVSSLARRFFAAGADAHHGHDHHKHSEPAIPAHGDPLGAVGFEKEELEGKFASDVLTGPFGTKEDPVVVPSIFDMRIVGCEGGPGDMQHDLIWHCVREGKPTVCLECGQYFQHVRREPVHHGLEDAHH